MPTTKDTWDTEPVDSFLEMAGRQALLKYIFWNCLEHDLGTAREMAATVSKKDVVKLRAQLQTFKDAYLSLRKTMLKITKCSDKY